MARQRLRQDLLPREAAGGERPGRCLVLDCPRMWKAGKEEGGSVGNCSNGGWNSRCGWNDIYHIGRGFYMGAQFTRFPPFS